MEADFEMTLLRSAERILHESRNLDLFDEDAVAETGAVRDLIQSELSSVAINAVIGCRVREVMNSISDSLVRLIHDRNQFYPLSDEVQGKMAATYGGFYRAVSHIAHDGEGRFDLLDGLILDHRRRLRATLGEPIEPKAAACYSCSFQLKLFDLTPSTVASPCLDIGCGPRAHLVEYLRSFGVEAYGVDRYIDRRVKYLASKDWLDLDLGVDAWGTVVSHMAFSNHFIHQYSCNNAEQYRYALLYRAILNALKPGGAFHYAPSLPFVEKYLDRHRFDIAHRRAPFGLETTSLYKLDY
jgi:hypothetical protein